MSELLQKLCDLDHLIEQSLSVKDIQAEEIVSMVDKREQLLQNLLSYVADHPQFAATPEWRDAINHTQHLAGLMQSKTMAIGQELKKYRHGHKSVQQYKKFL